ncbi:unnamed protein product [Penicillium pancosmium]
MAPSTGSTGTDSNTEWQNNLPRILVVQTIFTFLAILAVGLRLYVRIKLIKNTGADDWTMLIAALCALGGWILWVFEGTHGLGHSDAWFAEGNGDAIKVSQGSFWQVIIDSALGIAMLKISIALNLLRLSPARWDNWILFWAALQFTTGITAACIPSLKPLVSSVLKLSQYSNSRSQGPHGSHYPSQRAATGTRGSIHTMGGVGGNHMWSIHRGDQYALQELGSRGSGDGSNSDEVRLTQNGDYNVTAAYTQNFSAADETSPGHASKYGSKSGIVKTTEVIVH